MDEELFLKLRYCFAAGYTMPQFCVDKGIRRPLFVFEKSSEGFLSEIYAQFKFDGRLTAQFCFINGDDGGIKIPLDLRVLGMNILVKSISAINLARVDKIILLTAKMPDIDNKKIITFADLEEFFVGRVYVDIPLLKFLQRYPKVKLILTTKFPRIDRYKGSSGFGSKLWNAEKLRRTLIENKGDSIKTTLDRFGYTNAEVVHLLESDKSKKILTEQLRSWTISTR